METIIRLVKLFVVLLFLYHAVLSLPNEKKGFVVTAPSTLLAGSEEHVCATVHNSTRPVRVTATLRGTHSNLVLAIADFTVNKVGCGSLHVPQTTEQSARLVAHVQSADEHLSGISEQSVSLQSEPRLSLVTTDKPIYKPGQNVRFRVLTLNHRLKPINGVIEFIWIESPTGVRVQQWRGLEVKEFGLTQLEFTLDKEPFLGQWRIKVQHNSLKTVERSFLVKEYVPVKFEVTVENLQDIFPDSEDVSWQACARYSFGEVVKGDVHLEIKLQGSRAADEPSINHAAKLNPYTGCVDVTVKGSILGLADPSIHPTSVQVVATVTEKDSGLSHSSTVESPVQHQRFALEFQCSRYFKPSLPYKGHVVMKTMDGRVRLGVGERIQVCVKTRHRGELAMKLLHCWNYTTDFSSHVVFALPDIADSLNVQVITIIASATDHPTKLYPGSSEVMMLQPSVTLNVKPWYSPSHSYLDVWTRSSLACGSTHQLTVYYSVPNENASTPEFYSLVQSRGDLLSVNSVVPTDENIVHSNAIGQDAQETSIVRSWRLPIQVVPEMSPSSHLTVYYIRPDGEVVAGSTHLLVDRCFQNKVRARWQSAQVSPRDPAGLCIRSSPNSMCGVTVTDSRLSFGHPPPPTADVWSLLRRFDIKRPQRDQRLYCSNKTPNEEVTPPSYDLRRKRSMSLFPQDFSDHVDTITAFDDLGVAVISSFELESRPCFAPAYSPGAYRRSWDIRNDVMERNSFAGNMVLVVQNEDVTAEMEMQSLIRDHFPETWIWSLVYTGKEGEVVMNDAVPDSLTSWDTSVTCVSERDGLGVGAPTSLAVSLPFFVDIEAPYSMKKGESVKVKAIVYNYMHHPMPIVMSFPGNGGLQISPGNSVRTCLKELSLFSYVVSVSAETAGTVNLTVQAKTEPRSSCGPPYYTQRSDTVVKNLLVKHDGYVQQKSQSALICPSEDSNSTIRWDFEMPEEGNVIPGSPQLKFTVTADLFGPAIENLDSLVPLPMGCGEQNLARLAPNLFLLKYMQATGHSDQQLRQTAMKNVNKGYQRQLTFQRSDGSFSPFGEKDETGSIWLTAAVVKTISEARDLIEIDSESLQSAVKWITRQQLENGCFPAIGQVFHREIREEGPDESTSALSALVLLQLAGSGLSLPAALANNAQFCLDTALASADPYTLTLTALALARLGLRHKATEALNMLLRLAVTQEDLVHWGKPDSSLSDNIVTTSYAVLTLVESGGRQNLIVARKAARWIATHRNENGGFISTQDTVVALEALTAYITAVPQATSTQLTVMVTGDQLIRSFTLTDDNKLLQQQLIANEVPSYLTTHVTGQGCAFIQSTLSYNARSMAAGGPLELRVSSAAVSFVDPCATQELRLCASSPSPSPTPMALLTLLMVTGYTPDRNQLRTLTHPNVKKWEEEDDQISFYLTDVNNIPLCFNLLLTRKFEVEDPLPAPATLMDYYHPEIAVSKSYSLQCSSITPLDEPLMQADSPSNKDDSFGGFHNVDFELETPEGVEGPKPVYACPPNSTIPNCQMLVKPSH